MKNNILKGLLSLVFLAVALPVISQDFMNIFFKDGNSRKFYLNEIIEFKASNIDADGIQHDSYCYQYIKTATNEYIYSLEDVDSISFAKRDEALEEENFVNAMTSVFPIINACSDINDVESHLDAIKTAEGVEHAWTDGHQLYVEIEDGEIISFHFDHNELIDETSIEGMTSDIKALAPKLSHIVKPDGSRLKFAIANQQDKDESRNGQKGSYFLPLVQALTGCGIDVDYIPEPSVEFFYNNSDNPSDHLNFYDYDAVLFSTHGSYSEPFIYDFWFGDSFGPKVHSVSISDDLFLEEYEADSIVPNWHDNYKIFKKWRKQLNLSDVTDHHINYSFNKEKRDGKLYWVAHPNLTELFFRDIALGKFENPSSIFFNCACQSLMENDSFAEELMNNHGLGVYAGYTESNYFGQLSGYTLFSKLFSTLSLERAYQDLPSYMRHESLANINISGDFDIDSKMYYREKGVSDARLKILPENSLIIDELFILPVYTNFTTQENITNEYNKSKTVKLSGTLTCLTQVKDVKLGFLYGTSSIPTQEVEATSTSKIFNLGKGNIEFTVELPNLERGKTYSYRAFTNDGFHYNYGDIYSFTIPSDLQISSNNVVLSIGGTSTINIISGSGDYRLEYLDDASSIINVTLNGSTISVKALTAGDAEFNIVDSQSGTIITVTVTVNAAPAVISIEPTEIKFGYVKVGESKTSKFTVTNTGESDLIFTVSETHTEIDIPESGKEFTLAPTKSKVFDVVFTPKAENTGSGSAVRVFSNAENGTQFIEITGQSYPSDIDVPTTECPDDNHPHMIDLGLPSGILWSCCNVGASSPEIRGSNYAWGEITPKWYSASGEYSMDISGSGMGARWDMTKYGVDSRFGIIDNKTTLDLSDDVAHTTYGANYRMPTAEEFNELLTQCTSEWGTLNGSNGRYFTGPNGGKIFLPTTGIWSYGARKYDDEYGNYWTRNLYLDYCYCAQTIFFSENDAEMLHEERYKCKPVRPVIVPKVSALSDFKLSGSDELQLSKGETLTVDVASGNGKYGSSTDVPSLVSSTSNDRSIYITGLNSGTMTFTAHDIYSGQEARIKVTVCPAKETPADAIDLGLPSGTKWASHNIGARSPEGYGTYFSWGETSGKDDYSWSTYLYGTNKYTDINIGENISGTCYDVAHMKWGGSWQMPTDEQINELIENCTSEWTTVNGINCKRFTGPNGRSIILPAAGLYNQSELLNAGQSGCYWGANACYFHQYGEVYAQASLIWFDQSNSYNSSDSKYYGQPIRPVCK